LKEILHRLDPRAADALLEEIGEKNTVRVIKHKAIRPDKNGGLIHRVTFDELFGAENQKMSRYALIRLDEMRILNGLKPRYLWEAIRMTGGELVSVTPNLRTDVGKDYVAESLGKTASRPAVADYMALTENATAPAAGDTTLASEITTNGLARAQATFAHTTNTTSYTLSKTFTASGAFTAVQKEALFNAAGPPPAGTMFVENTFTSTALASSDQLTVTHTINI
jgi:hypothetical protein